MNDDGRLHCLRRKHGPWNIAGVGVCSVVWTLCLSRALQGLRATSRMLCVPSWLLACPLSLLLMRQLVRRWQPAWLVEPGNCKGGLQAFAVQAGASSWCRVVHLVLECTYTRTQCVLHAVRLALAGPANTGHAGGSSGWAAWRSVCGLSSRPSTGADQCHCSNACCSCRLLWQGCRLGRAAALGTHVQVAFLVGDSVCVHCSGCCWGDTSSACMLCQVSVWQVANRCNGHVSCVELLACRGLQLLPRSSMCMLACWSVQPNVNALPFTAVPGWPCGVVTLVCTH
jgi:hypothetical protein